MKAILVCLVVVMLGFWSAEAQAKDFCFNSTSPPNPAPPDNPDILIVVRGNPIPGKGKCKAVAGFEVALYSQLDSTPVTGTVCRNSAGDEIKAGFNVHGFGGLDPRQVSMNLPYPSLAGGGVTINTFHTEIGGGTTGVVRFDGLAGPCGFTFPIP